MNPFKFFYFFFSYLWSASLVLLVLFLLSCGLVAGLFFSEQSAYMVMECNACVKYVMSWGDAIYLGAITALTVG